MNCARFLFVSFPFSSNSKETFFIQKERRIEQLQSIIDDHERTIVKFRDTVKNMQVRLS